MENAEKKALYDIIDADAADFEAMSDFVWDHPETCFREFESTRYQREYMEKQGFRITTPVAGMKTAFIAEYGSGKPVLAMLGENDALANQSQVAGITEQRALVPGGNGHACGHNLHGTGAIEGVCALKKYMEAHKLPGTLRYYACPAEEGGGGKVYMSAAGVFNDVDACVSWHPFAKFSVTRNHLALVMFNLSFKGIASHASGSPWDGRSALDAMELTNVGIQFLREHIKPTARIHYAFLDAGGTAANVVQSCVKGQYCCRATTVEYVEELYNRVVDIARGAALRTGTTLEEPEILTALSEKIGNDTLEQLMVDNITSILPLEYTAEELAYAKELQKHGSMPDFPTPIDYNFYDDRALPGTGSSDCSDVSHVTPLVQLYSCCAPAGAINHGWTTTTVGKSSIAKKGMHASAKALAATLLDLYLNPDLVAKVREDFKAAGGGKPYHTLMPLDKLPDYS